MAAGTCRIRNVVSDQDSGRRLLRLLHLLRLCGASQCITLNVSISQNPLGSHVCREVPWSQEEAAVAFRGRKRPKKSGLRHVNRWLQQAEGGVRRGKRTKEKPMRWPSPPLCWDFLKECSRGRSFPSQLRPTPGTNAEGASFILASFQFASKEARISRCAASRSVSSGRC